MLVIFCLILRRGWKPSPVFLSGEFHGQRHLEGYSPWDHKESDTTEWLNWTDIVKKHLPHGAVIFNDHYFKHCTMYGSNILVEEIWWTEAPRGLQSMESQKVRHDLVTKQQPLPCMAYGISLIGSCELFLSITPQSDLWAVSPNVGSVVAGCVPPLGSWFFNQLSMPMGSGWCWWSHGRCPAYETLIPATHRILRSWSYVEASWLSAGVGKRPSPLFLISYVFVVLPYTVQWLFWIFFSSYR